MSDSKKTSSNERNDFIELDQYTHSIDEESVHRKIIYVEYLSIFLTISCFILTTCKASLIIHLYSNKNQQILSLNPT